VFGGFSDLNFFIMKVDESLLLRLQSQSSARCTKSRFSEQFDATMCETTFPIAIAQSYMEFDLGPSSISIYIFKEKKIYVRHSKLILVVTKRTFPQQFGIAPQIQSRMEHPWVLPQESHGYHTSTVNDPYTKMRYCLWALVCKHWCPKNQYKAKIGIWKGNGPFFAWIR
jgi:hypothetical protein